jgi:heterodisulfide reductase subunit A
MKNAAHNVLVIGGSIAGIQAAIDLAEMGFQVHLVERTPSIGGRMAQLDKTFPTNDCSICILAPKMIECYQHPDVHAYMYSDVLEVNGTLGNFRVKIRCNPTYVNWDKCTGCGECMEKCPKKVPNEFNMKLDTRKAIYMPFLQAVPKKATIDRDNCIYLTKGKCKLCEKTCTRGAIEFEQKERIVALNVAAIIVATGFDFYDIRKIDEYGYGMYENIITAMEFERLICASGPTHGHLERPSDGSIPKRIAFIQCVGSRDFKYLPYCSGVCCMHAVKEAILANEHYLDITSYIFYMDLRAVGKWFQEYIMRAESEYNVKFIRSRPSKITEKLENRNLIIRYEDTRTREVKEAEFELVILSQALVPSQSTKPLANILGISTDKYGFIRIPDRLRAPVDTTKPGIFAIGYCQQPQDIPDSVAQASSAAARVAEVLSS